MPMGRLRPSFGMKEKPMAWRLPATKSQYLKKNSRARLKMTDEATAHRAPRSLPLRLYFSTSIPWV
jgi:hypothetical protein